LQQNIASILMYLFNLDLITRYEVLTVILLKIKVRCNAVWSGNYKLL
jgi:hypothetical protein